MSDGQSSSDDNIFSQEYTQTRAQFPQVQFSAQPTSSSSGASSHEHKSGSGHYMLAAVLAVAVLLLIVIMYYVVDDSCLAKRLARSGWTVYYRKGCHYCKKQKSVLDGKFRQTVKCDVDGSLLRSYTATPALSCKDPIITGFPFWYNTRTKDTRVGLQSKEKLELMTM